MSNVTDLSRAKGFESERIAVALVTEPIFLRIFVVVGLIVLWEIVARVFGNPMFSAAPSSSFLAMFELLGRKAILAALWWVLVACVISFVLSFVVGTLIGLVVGANSFMRDAFFPIVLMLYAMPQSPFLPLITIWLGTGLEAKIAYGFSHGIFPMAVTVISGLQGVDEGLLRAARSMGANRRQRLQKVILPFLLQSLFTGMRLTMATVVLGVLLSELYISNGGIGYFTKLFSNKFEPHNLYALIAVLALIAITLNESCRRIEIAYSKWRSTD